MKSQRLFVQRAPKEHIATLLKNIVVQLGVSVPFDSIEQTVTNHPLCPHIEDLNDVLNRWGVSTKSFTCAFQNLRSLKTPFLARTKHTSSPFLLVCDVNDGFLTCIDTQKGLCKLNPYLFLENWSGVISVFETTVDCGEKVPNQKSVFFQSLTDWFLNRSKTKKINTLEAQLEKLRRYKHPQVTKQLFAASPTVHLPRSAYAIFCGEAHANIQLSLVVSPTNDLSAKRFDALKKLVETNLGLRLSVYFMPENMVSSEVINSILAFRWSHSPQQSMELLQHWFRNESKNLSSFISDNLIEYSDKQRLKPIFEDQAYLMQNIKGLPVNTLVLNGKVIPELFEWEDTLYLIRNSMLRTQNQSNTTKDKFWKNARPAFVE